MIFVNILIFLPLLTAFVILFTNLKARYILTIVTVLALSSISIYLDMRGESVSFSFSPFLHKLFIVADFAVLFYFLKEGIKHRHKLAFLFAFSQILLYSYLQYILPSEHFEDIRVDFLSIFMYFIINIVGGIITIYAIKYIEDENLNPFRKKVFLSILFFFIGVMNFLVSLNSLELFFLAFELTTLCSYILISYRRDEVSIQNSLLALWMNQIGGASLLLGLIYLILTQKPLYFSELLNHHFISLIPYVLISIAAFVKGASLPFNRWLLGAMVAPTPVSAILHSATMVKIAPYLIIKIAPLFSIALANMISIFGAFVFLVAGVLALSRDYFKEVLGYSTISLLALMISLAAINTPETTIACLILILFHSISKALLFLQAGVLEKVYHKKYISDFNSLSLNARKTLFFILIGFISITIPPFGAFIGKFLALLSFSKEALVNPFAIFTTVFISLGSVVLTLLYFKVMSKILTQSFGEVKREVLPKTYFFTSSLLFTLLLLCTIFILGFANLTLLEFLTPFMLIFLSLFLINFVKLKNVDRVKEYHCGEKEEAVLSMYYFDVGEFEKKIIFISIIFIISIFLVGAL